MDPFKRHYCHWLRIISLAVFYNVIIIIARSVFHQLQDNYLSVYLVLDYCCDAVYILDMLIKARTGEGGGKSL